MTSAEDVLTPTDRTRLRRKADRGAFDRATIHAIVDEAFVAHVGIATADGPLVIPMTYGRIGDELYLHGAAANHLLRAAAGTQVCVTVTLLDGLVLARSQFHHSMNYRSVVVFGPARLVEDEAEKDAALAAVVDHMVPGRTGAARTPTPGEIRQTRVVAVTLDEASAKVRTGGPVDEPDDLDLPVWAGVIPVTTTLGTPVPDDGAAPADLPAPRLAASGHRFEEANWTPSTGERNAP